MSKNAFVYLSAFNSQGGIEQFNRSFIKALNENFPNSKFYSLYDQKKSIDSSYIPKNKILTKKIAKPISAFLVLVDLIFNPPEKVIWGHINLSPLGIILKKLRPKTKQILIAHGIEIWQNVDGRKNDFTGIVDEIWAVSTFTKSELIRIYKVANGKIKIFPNTIDPFFPVPNEFDKKIELMKLLGIDESAKTILTLCRLSKSEGYKGYDRVIQALAKMPKDYQYILVGKYDDDEKLRLDKLCEALSISNVTFTGFVPKQELVDYIQLADVFIMPSLNEGFGIVFIEAMVCGVPAIGGNKDGSVDALRNGELGTLINPMDKQEIRRAIMELAEVSRRETVYEKQVRANRIISCFGFEKYKKKQLDLLTNN